MDCIFCKIVEREIPAEIVYEDEQVIAFLDIKPDYRGHTLVVPKKHSPSFLETPDEILEGLLPRLKTIAGAVVSAVDAEGFRLVVNNGRSAGQIVFHLHFHILPQAGRPPAPNSPEFKQLAESIRQQFSS